MKVLEIGPSETKGQVLRAVDVDNGLFPRPLHRPQVEIFAEGAAPFRRMNVEQVVFPPTGQKLRRTDRAEETGGGRLFPAGGFGAGPVWQLETGAGGPAEASVNGIQQPHRQTSINVGGKAVHFKLPAQNLALPDAPDRAKGDL